MLSNVGRLVKILMRDLSESNVISIGFSSAPGKSACRFLLLPQRSGVACGSPRRALRSRITIPPKYRSQKLDISATADTCLTLPFHRFPNSHRENRTAQSPFMQVLGTCSWHACFLRRRCHRSANGSRGSGRRPAPAARRPSSSGWDRALGGQGCRAAKLVVAVWGENVILHLVHVWWGLPGRRSRGKREGPRCRVFLKALPYF